mmetsp:Transcript_65319/g.136817  ORF Transcript_65319/g.136817 Transcript_65319/m.136817 type:complete len:199 (-) Transcript_65319:132-728(-)
MPMRSEKQMTPTLKDVDVVGGTITRKEAKDKDKEAFSSQRKAKDESAVSIEGIFTVRQSQHGDDTTSRKTVTRARPVAATAVRTAEKAEAGTCGAFDADRRPLQQQRAPPPKHPVRLQLFIPKATVRPACSQEAVAAWVIITTSITITTSREESSDHCRSPAVVRESQRTPEVPLGNGQTPMLPRRRDITNGVVAGGD